MPALRLNRPLVALVHDLLMAAASLVISIALRLGDGAAEVPLDSLLLWVGLFVAISAAVFHFTRLHRGIWRYASLNDLAAIAKSATLIILVFLPATFLLTRLQDLPRSVIVINWLVLVTLLAVPRILYRFFKDGSFGLAFDPGGDPRVPALLVGAGDAAELFIQAMDRPARAEYRVVGIVDDAPSRIGRNLRGIDVIGGLADLPQAVERLARRGRRPQRLILTTPDLQGAKLQALLDQADALGLTVARVPRLADLRAAEVASGTARLEVQSIAIEDLLGRPQTVLDRAPMKALIAGRRVMVTGAGGTIGAELVRQIADLGPARLVLVDNSEFNLYSIDLELGERVRDLPRRAVLADVRDRGRVAALLVEDRPDLVFHAAALKHVPMVESHPAEGALTNAIGTRNVADACRAAGAAAMVLISTDKAVNPSSAMGATKRLAEGYCQALDLVCRQRPGGTRFVTVRFGNVLGSTGSVVPLFQRQLAAGGPLTVTHPDMKRYFMTVREAVELVLQASALGASDHQEWTGKILVLDMGEPVRILDLARQMIRLAGLRPDRDVKIAFTGLRPGEKLSEELFHAAEALAPTALKGVQFASPRTADHAFLARAMDELAEAAAAGRIDQTCVLLRRLVPEYQAAHDEGAAASRVHTAP